MVQIDDSTAVLGGGGNHLGVVQPVCVQQPDEILATGGERLWSQAVGLVQDDHRDCVVSREPRDVVLVQARVGVLLWVGDPDEHVDQVEHSVGLGAVRLLERVEVGQIKQNQPVKLR